MAKATVTKRTVEFPDLPAGREYLAIAPFCWGKDAKAKTAIANAKKNRIRIYEGKQGWCYILYDVPTDAYVNDMGGINAPMGSEIREVMRFNIPVAADDAAKTA